MWNHTLRCVSLRPCAPYVSLGIRRDSTAKFSKFKQKTNDVRISQCLGRNLVILCVIEIICYSVTLEHLGTDWNKEAGFTCKHNAYCAVGKLWLYFMESNRTTGKNVRSSRIIGTKVGTFTVCFIRTVLKSWCNRLLDNRFIGSQDSIASGLRRRRWDIADRWLVAGIKMYEPY